MTVRNQKLPNCFDFDEPRLSYVAKHASGRFVARE
jgi:hypothetical protein